MAIREIAQLKTWFERGKYPTAAQFADWLDSFVHRSEKLPISAVESLAEALNAKFDAAKARLMEEAVAAADATATELKGDVTNAFESIARIENQVEGECLQRTTRLVLHGGAPADLVPTLEPVPGPDPTPDPAAASSADDPVPAASAPAVSDPASAPAAASSAGAPVPAVSDPASAPAASASSTPDPASDPAAAVPAPSDPASASSAPANANTPAELP